MKPVFISTILDSFFSSSFGVILPLLMAERGVDLASIGIVFALYPLVFQALRMLLAVVADSRGVRKLFLLNAFLYPLTGITYFIANSIPFFLLGKFFEGVRSASLVAVNRTAAYNSLKRDPAVTSSLFSLTTIADGVGKLVVGALLAFLSLSSSLLFLSITSLSMLIPAKLLKEKKNAAVKSFSLDFKTKPRIFSKIMIAITFFSVSNALVYDFIFPLFLKHKGLGLLDIGLYLAVFSFISGFSSICILLLKERVSSGKVLFAHLFLGTLALAAMPFASPDSLLAAVIVLAVTDGITRIIFEQLVVKAVSDSKQLSIDIGLLHVPFYIIRAVALLSAGFIASSYGFAAVFLVSAAFFLFYSLSITRFYYPEYFNVY